MLYPLILYMSGGTYSLKSTTSDRFFEKLFMAIFFTFRVFARNLLKGSHRRNIFILSFLCLTWALNLGLTSNKPTHYLLDYGDFIYYINLLIHWEPKEYSFKSFFLLNSLFSLIICIL